MFESRIGMIPLSKPLVIALFKDLRKDEIVDLATNTGKTATFDIALFMKAKVDVESFLEWFESRMISSSINVSHIINGSTNTYIIKHDVCLNWSLYHKIILESIFDEYFKKDVDIKMSETSFTIQYEK
jgi:hypothetical protein